MSDCLGIGTAVGGATQAGADIYGAASVAQTNANNLAAQQARQALVQQYMNQYMTQAQSPYASATMQFLAGGIAPGGGYQGSGAITNTPPGQVTTLFGGPQNGQTTGGGGPASAPSGGGGGGGGSVPSGTPTGSDPSGQGAGPAYNAMPNIPALLQSYAASAPTFQSSGQVTAAPAPATPVNPQAVQSYQQQQTDYNAYIAGGQSPQAAQMQVQQDYGGAYIASDPSAPQVSAAATPTTPSYNQGQGYYQALVSMGIAPAQATQYAQQLGGGTVNGGGVPGASTTVNGQQATVNGQGQLIAGAPAQGQPIYQPDGTLIGYTGAPGMQPTTASGVPSTIPANYTGVPQTGTGTVTGDPSQSNQGTTVNGTQYTPGQSATLTYPGAPTGSAPSGGVAPTFGTQTGSPNMGQGGGVLPSIYNYQAQNPFTYQAAQIGSPAAPAGTQGFNSGQDGMLQMMRQSFMAGQPGGQGANAPYSAAQNTGLNQAIQQGATNMPAFNTSPEEQAVNNLNMFNLQQQVNNLQGSAGSLGARFGTALNYNQGQMTANALTNNSAQLQQIAQSSFNTQQANQLQAQGLGVQNLANYNSNTLAGLQSNQAALNQAGQFNAAAGQTMSAQNAQQGNIFNNLMLSGSQQAAGQQQSQTGQNTSLLGLLAGLSVPQAQSSPYPGAANNIGQMATLYPFLNQLMQPAGSSTSGGTSSSNVNVGLQ